VLVVDVTDINNLPLVVDEVRRLGNEGGGKDLPVLVLGNKSDLLPPGGKAPLANEKDLAEALQLEKWLRNGDRMWTVRMVTATDMDTIAHALLWAIEERFRF
jgi:hypothetical protein